MTSSMTSLMIASATLYFTAQVEPVIQTKLPRSTARTRRTSQVLI